MELYLAVLLLLLSFLIIGIVIERYFIPSLVNIAEWLKMPEDVAGATLLAFGSSAPELFTALLSLFLVQSRPSFGVGNIVGSALFQVLVVIGFTAMVKRVYLQWRPVLRDGTFYALAVLLFYLLIHDGTLSAWDGGMLIAAYMVYLSLLLLWARFFPENDKKEWQRTPCKHDNSHGNGSTRKSILKRLAKRVDPLPNPRERPIWTIPLFFLSLVIIGWGTYIFLRSGETIAAFLGIDPTIVALTIIAGGSSVPELISSAIVARRGKGDMAIANALGSNTFDICIGLGLPVLLATLIHGPVKNIGGANITSTTILLLGTLLMVLGLLVMQKFKADRPFGILLIVVYACYVLAAFKGWIR